MLRHEERIASCEFIQERLGTSLFEFHLNDPRHIEYIIYPLDANGASIKLVDLYHYCKEEIPLDHLIHQIPEYAALSALLCGTYPNSLLLDTGNAVMRIFMHGLAKKPRPMIGLDIKK